MSNHVTFSDDPPASTGAGASIAAASTEAGPSRQPYVHPARLISGVHTPAVPKQKNKSENQKRYEKKKEKRRKKVLKAKKAAAPKNKEKKEWKVDPVAEALRRATAVAAVAGVAGTAPSGSTGLKADVADVAGTRMVDATGGVDEADKGKTAAKTEQKEKKEKKGKSKKSEPVVIGTTSGAKLEGEEGKKGKKSKRKQPDPEADGTTAEPELDSEAEREKRRKEKREKRETRDRKERRALEREAKEKAEKERERKREEAEARAVEFASRAADGAMDVDGLLPTAPAGDEAESSDEESDEEQEQEPATTEGASADPLAPTSMRDSPPPLQPFPLPRAAPAPSAALLARQGLPAGLEDAEFIDQDLRVGIDELVVQRSGGGRRDEKDEAEGQGSKESGLSERMKGRLRDIGVDDFFAVQAAILPHLLPLRLTPLPYEKTNDYLISAPTGSGKTLAYAVPIVEILSQRIVTRLRALIVLPTRDLVGQVRETLEELAKGTGLNIGVVTGQHSFAQEQNQLVADLETPLLGGSSNLDILIATPGRLMDHLASTPNFTLQHLRFLVIDEADRLLNQSFQDWLAQVLSFIRPPEKSRVEQMYGTSEDIMKMREARPWDAVAPYWLEAFGLRKRDAEWMFRPKNVCQKLLFSATLTRDPSKVAALSLTSPKYYIVQSSSLPASATAIGSTFAIPSTLSEKMLILPPSLKPLNLIHLVHHDEYGVDRALVFTKSTESAMRLVKLLDFFEDAYLLGGGGKGRRVVRGYTGDLKATDRRKILAQFAKGEINLLVCSDLIARGMDLPAVSNVVSYDVPLDMRKYVHRVGRTARAGRKGTAWTLVEKQEALHFKGMLRGAGHLKDVKKVKVQEESLAGYRESYDIAMKRLKEHFGRDA